MLDLAEFPRAAPAALEIPGVVNDGAADDLEDGFENRTIVTIQRRFAQCVESAPATLEWFIELPDRILVLVQESEFPGRREDAAVGNVTGIEHDGVWDWSYEWWPRTDLHRHLPSQSRMLSLLELQGCWME